MRKAILVTALIFCISSTASAAISFNGPNTVELNQSVVIDIVSSNTLSYSAVLDCDTSLTVMKQFGGEIIQIFPPPGYSYWVLDATNPPFAGVHWKCTLTSTGSDLDTTYNLTIYNEAYTFTIDSHTVKVVPEPITIGLVGLGGLILCRRRSKKEM